MNTTGATYLPTTGNLLPVTGYQLPAIGDRRPATGNRLPATGYLLRAACYRRVLVELRELVHELFQFDRLYMILATGGSSLSCARS